MTIIQARSTQLVSGGRDQEPVNCCARWVRGLSFGDHRACAERLHDIGVVSCRAMGSPDPRVVRHLPHDLDDIYELLDTTNSAVTKIAATQRRRGNRLEEIQQALDLQNGPLDCIEDTQRQILDLLRGRDG